MFEFLNFITVTTADILMRMKVSVSASCPSALLNYRVELQVCLHGRFPDRPCVTWYCLALHFNGIVKRFQVTRYALQGSRKKY